MSRIIAIVVVVCCPVTLLWAGEPKSDETDKLFQSGEVLRLKLEVPETEVEKIGADHRPYVRAVLIENDNVTYKTIGIKMKGAAGSYREFGDRPALTLNMDKFKKKQQFHGLDKFHLNNSVQDESYLQEQLCSEIFREAGCPTPRATHARVWLNGRDVGLYVLKEGFDARFLKRNFADASGNLYDGGFVQDIDANLKKDEGDGPDDLSDVRAVADACRLPDPQERWNRMEKLIDMDAFIKFMALERMMCHWDGYSVNKNNYRLYFDPRKKQAIFLPHGLDQMFGDPGMPLFDQHEPLISAAVIQNNTWRKQYRKQVEMLLPLFVPADKLVQRVDGLASQLQPVLVEMGPEVATAHAERVNELKQHLIERAENLRVQLAEPDPEPEPFDSQGIARLTDLYPVMEVEDAKLEEVELPGKKKAYSISCGASGTCIASWRRQVLLGPGKYTFVARCQTKNVVGLEDDPNYGVGIRISQGERSGKLLGTAPAKRLEYEFTVQEDRRKIEVVAELRATKGQAWFEVDSLMLIKKAD